MLVFLFNFNGYEIQRIMNKQIPKRLHIKYFFNKLKYVWWGDSTIIKQYSHYKKKLYLVVLRHFFIYRLLNSEELVIIIMFCHFTL